MRHNLFNIIASRIFTSMKKEIQAVFTILLVMFVVIVNAQSTVPINFYKHFTGMLDANMFITLDLQATAGKLHGQYNYYFKMEDSEDDFYFGKTVPVKGEIENEKLTFFDYASEESKFICRFNEKGQLTGTWQGGRQQKDIQFTFEENYPEGSVPLSCYNADRVKNLLEGKDFEGISPKAKISINLLYPRKFFPANLRDTLDAIITQFWNNDKQPLKSPELLIENMVFNFFQSYVETTEGIEDPASIASFNWEKKLGMEVLCNQHNILTLKFTKYAFTGGAHGISIAQHHVFSLKMGRQLTLADLINPGDMEKLSVLLDKKFRKLNGLSADENLNEAGFFIEKIEPSHNFYINTNGIGFFYNTYEIAPYASGTTELFVSYQYIKDLLRTDHPLSWLK